MNAKQAHTSDALYIRETPTQFSIDYTLEQMRWLWIHDHIEWTKAYPENGDKPGVRFYIQFTKKGLLYHILYSRKFTNWFSLYFKFKYKKWNDNLL